MENKLYLILLSLFLFTACATNRIAMEKDKFGDGIIYRTGYIGLEQETSGDIDIQVQHNESSTGQSEYTLRILYVKEGGYLRPLNISSGKSLLLNIDGTIHELYSPDGAKGSGTKLKGFILPLWQEEAIYPNVSKKILKMISQAKNLKIKLIGTGGESIGLFPEIGKQAIGNLLNKKEIINVDGA